MLEDLTGDVEGEVGRVHDSAYEAETVGEQVRALVHDEDSVAVELQSGLEVPGVEVVGGLGGDEQHRPVGDVAFHVDPDDGHGILEVVELVLVELDAFGIVDLGFGFLPDGDHAVDDLVYLGGDVVLLGVALVVDLAGLLPLALFHGHVDGPADVVGVLLDETPEPLGLQELAVLLPVGILLDVHDDIGSDGLLLGGSDGVTVDSVGDPLVGLVGSGGLGDHGDPVGDHECGVESDSELTDCLGVASLLDGLPELQGTAVSDVSEVLLHLVSGHSDTVVGDGDGACVTVDDDGDLQVALVDSQRGIAEGFVVELVDGIRCIGDQLPQEDFLVGIDGVDHHVEDAFGFRFELSFCHVTASYQ